jgi:hypothetical protein
MNEFSQSMIEIILEPPPRLDTFGEAVRPIKSV